MKPVLYQGSVRIGKPRHSIGDIIGLTIGTTVTIFCLYGVALMACLILAGV